MIKDRLELFARAFSSGGCGCVRACHCGRIFYDGLNSYDWEEGELERLQANVNAECHDYSINTIYLAGNEYCMDCDCWHGQAETIMKWLDIYGCAVAKWLTLEKRRLTAEAARAPVVEGLA